MFFYKSNNYCKWIIIIELIISFLKHSFQESLKVHKTIAIKVYLCHYLIKIPLFGKFSQSVKTSLQLLSTYMLFSSTEKLEYFAYVLLYFFIDCRPSHQTDNFIYL